MTPFIDPWWLPVIFAGLMGLSILLYVILDGYDLGVGMLTRLEKDENRDLMVASIGPFWDANETWLVLGIGLLLVAFPLAHGLILTQLYLPVVLMLVALITMINTAGTADIPTLMGYAFSPQMQMWLWLAFFASFAVKMPMWPVHTWLPDAHVEAPTAGSVILAGVLLKMGGYGFLRFSLPMLPEASMAFAPMVFWLSVIAIIYTSLVALVQQDMKKMIAYSSVAHMGFVTLGIFTFNTQGVEGAVFQMISHGVISAALFLSVGVVYDRLHTRDINRYGNLSKNMPFYACVFVILMLGSVGLPGTSGFVGEFLALLGAFKVNTVVATFAATGVVFGAAYMLHLGRKIVFGPKVNDDAAAMPDLNGREIFYFLPLVVLVIWLGIAPNYVLDRIAPSVDGIVKQYRTENPAVVVPTIDTAAEQPQPVKEDK